MGQILKGAGVVAAVAAAAAVALWRTLEPLLLAFAQVLLALVVIFEEWGWEPLAAALGRLARFRPIARLESWIAGLPPYGALAVYALPMTLLFPLKLVAVWLLAQGQVLLAGALFVGVKIVSTASIARIFMLTKPALMQISWFARAYAWFVPWEQAALAWLRASWAWRAGRGVKILLERRVLPWARRAAADGWMICRGTTLAAQLRARRSIAKTAGYLRRLRAAGRRLWARQTSRRVRPPS